MTADEVHHRRAQGDRQRRRRHRPRRARPSSLSHQVESTTAYDTLMRHQAARLSGGALTRPTGARPVRAEDAFDVDAAVGLAARIDADERYPARQAALGSPPSSVLGGASNLTSCASPTSTSCSAEVHQHQGQGRPRHRNIKSTGSRPPCSPFPLHRDDGRDVRRPPRCSVARATSSTGSSGRCRDARCPSDLSPDQARRLCESMLDGLVALHAVDLAKAGLEGFGRAGLHPPQVEGW